MQACLSDSSMPVILAPLKGPRSDATWARRSPFGSLLHYFFSSSLLASQRSAAQLLCAAIHR
jgi:hypothetical protein